MRYYRVVDDVYIKGRWHLGIPYDPRGNEIDPRNFTEGRRFPSDCITLEVSIRVNGTPLDFTFGAFDMPVVTTRVADVLSLFCTNDLQRLKAIVGNIGNYEIANILNTSPCLDEQISEIMWWGENDGRPEKIGQYRMVSKMAVDPDRARPYHILRIAGWEIALVVSEVVKDALEELHVTGIKFKAV